MKLVNCMKDDRAILIQEVCHPSPGEAREVPLQLRWVTCSQEAVEHRRWSLAEVT
jgi:hypothetical protein